MLENLKEQVCKANIELQKRSLIIYSWGNVSGIDRENGIIAIKPSGVSYDELVPEKIVMIDIDGKVVEGEMTPSSDAPTHIELYRQFECIGGICHTHAAASTAWAQAKTAIPCLGTTGADYFYGDIPVTRMLSESEIKTDYELNTGKVIVETFRQLKLDASQMPAVLVAAHGPFTWGKDASQAVEAAVVLEQIAKMAIDTTVISQKFEPIPQTLLDKHYFRKHGENAYYGQK